MHEDLARAQMAARLGEAQDLRRGRQIVAARRLSRRAERAALQARLVLARSFPLLNIKNVQSSGEDEPSPLQVFSNTANKVKIAV